MLRDRQVEKPIKRITAARFSTNNIPQYPFKMATFQELFTQLSDPEFCEIPATNSCNPGNSGHKIWQSWKFLPQNLSILDNPATESGKYGNSEFWPIEPGNPGKTTKIWLFWKL